MRRFLLIAILVLAGLFVVAIGLGTWLLNDEEFLKEQVAKYTREYTGRELLIAGPLKLDLGRDTTIEASGITLGNAPWAENPYMLEIGHARVTLEVPSLFEDLVYLPYLQLEDCTVEILENEAGAGNWDFPGDVEEDEEKDPGLLAVALNDLVIENCSLVYDEPGRAKPLDVRIDTATLKRQLHDRVVGEVSGSVNGEVLDVDGWLSPASAFVEGGEIRHELSFRAGAVTLDSSGSIADIDTFSSPDIEGHFRGPDIGRFLEAFSLPPLADGAFDFRAGIISREGNVQIDVDGDLGNLDIVIDGVVDKLLAPSAGEIRMSATGPDLRAMGQALDVDGMVPEPYKLDAELLFEKSAVQVRLARLETERDSLQLAGTLSTLDGMAGSDLILAFESAEIGRWLPVLDRPEEAIGEISLEGDLTVDGTGLASIDTLVKHKQSELSVNGAIGSLSGTLEPELDFDFSSSNMPRLAALVGYQGFPARPFTLKGHARKSGQELRLSGLELSLSRSTASASGTLNLVSGFSGSSIDADINIPDVAEFGLLFGVDDLLQEPLHVRGEARLENGGLAFRIDDSALGEIRMALDGRIVDLEKPMGIDASFDLFLPGLRFLRIWFPDFDPPEAPFAARGHFINKPDRTELDSIRVRLGDIEADIEGHVDHDQQFDLAVRASGPDMAILEGQLGVDLGNLPFELSSRIAGNPSAFVLDDLELKSRKSEIAGTLAVELGEVKRVSGELVSPYLNLNRWTDTEEETEPTPGEPSRYLFDDTPVASITDVGMEVDLDVTINEFNLGNARYDRVEVGLLLLRNRIEVRPFTVTGEFGGTISGEYLLDSSGEVPRLEADLRITDMKLEMGALEGQDRATLPAGNIDLELHGTGRTRREMVSGLDGKVRLSVGPGTLAPAGYSFLLGDFTTELFNTLNPFSEPNQYTQLECAIAAADITSGQVKLDPTILVTNQLTIVSQGRIDLDTERLDITYNTMQRKGLGISASDLVNPFVKVGGTLLSPSLELDPTGTVVKGGIAAATAGLSILATSLAERYLGSKDPCGKALREIEERDVIEKN